MEVGVRVKTDKRADGYETEDLTTTFPPGTNLTLTDQTARPVRLSVQNRTFRGLGASATTSSGGISGKTGFVSSCLAEVVGKYIFWAEGR